MSTVAGLCGEDAQNVSPEVVVIYDKRGGGGWETGSLQNATNYCATVAVWGMTAI